MAGPPQIKFTYNSVEYRVHQLHRFNVTDDRLQFSASFHVEGEDATELQTNHAQGATLAKDFQNFKLTYGSKTIFEWKHDDNTGFNTRATISKSGSGYDTAYGLLMSFDLQAEREPQDSDRAGRRSADIAIDADAAAMITVRFSGVWTAVVSGPTDARTKYLAQVATWCAGWLTTIGLHTTSSGATGFWQLLSEAYNFDDENKVLQFNRSYKECLPEATPGEHTEGLYTTGTFSRIDPPQFGAVQTGNVPLGGGGAYAPGLGLGGGNGSGYPQNVSVETTTQLTRAHTPHTNPNTYWETYIRPWIRAEIQAIFTWSAGRTIIFERHTVPIVDVETKQVRCTAQVLILGASEIIEYQESITRQNDRNLISEYVWDGQIDHYDLIEGGRRMEVNQQISIKKANSESSSPPYLTNPPWEFLRESLPQKKQILDPITDAVIAWEITYNRQYLYVLSTPAAGERVTTPMPLGRQGGGGAQITVPPGAGYRPGGQTSNRPVLSP